MNPDVAAWLGSTEGGQWSRGRFGTGDRHWTDFPEPPSTQFTASGLDPASDPCGAPPVRTVTR